MSLTVINSPSTILSNTFESKFSFGGNPIYYDIQRKDKTISGVGSSGGNVAFNMGTGTSIFSVSDSIYVRATDGTTTTIDGQYTIVTSDVILGYNWISINLPIFSGYTNIDGGFVNNLERHNHRVICNLLINGVVTSERSFSTDITGLARVYVNSITDNYLSKEIDIDYTAINKLLTDYAIPFQIGYKEGWLGYLETVPKYALIQYWAVKSITQLGHDNRMIDYEVYYVSNVIYSTAKFLTSFARPKMWVGYPFTVAALLTDLNAVVTKEIKSYPAVSQTSETIDMAGGKGVYSLKINPATGSQRCELWLQTDGTITPGLNNYNNNYFTNYVEYTP